MSPTAEPTIRSGKTRVLGGITVSDTPLIARAIEYARTTSEPYLFNHAVRSWLFAVRLATGQTFYEGPNDIHVVRRNASSTKPAKFAVFLLKKQGAPAVVPTRAD
jgi:hypothetical protein